MDGDGGFSSSGDGGFSSSGDGGFSSHGDTGFSSSGDGGFNSSGNGGFGSGGGDGGFESSGGGGGFGSSGGTNYNNDSRCYSIDQGEDNQTKWNQGPFITSCDEVDKATYIMEDGDNDKSHGLSYIYPALAAASFTKDPLPNENGEAPMSLLLADSADLEEQADGTGDGNGCGAVDFLYYSLVCCCTIM